jgi:predicted amidohydrolase
MRLTLVQSDIVWESAAASLSRLDALLAKVETDLIVLPEMFSTGFSMKASAIAEPEDGPSFRWMLQKSAALKAVLIGSVPTKTTEGKAVNRLYVTFPDGRHLHYDKKHLFTLAKEHEHYEPGTQKLQFEWLGWRIFPLVCYDLRFPVWARNTAQAPYDLLIYIANWPKQRRLHWSALLQARAIENQAVCAGVNRVGEDGNGHHYSGDSCLIAASGEKLWEHSDTESVFTTTLNKADLLELRQRLPFLNDADSFTLI